MNLFNNEFEGQLEFYNDYLPLIDSNLSMDDVVEGNHDGVVNGNIIEFKMNISDINMVLFQSIKYLSQMRVKGKDLPANIILIDLSRSIAYVYKSNDFLSHIETIYDNSASTNNKGFYSTSKPQKINFKTNSSLEQKKLIDVLKEKNICKYHVDENCIIGLSERYYRNNKNASKIDLLGDNTGKIRVLGEIRKPNYYKNTIYPYTENTNKKMAYIMDKLNPNMLQKDLGAFFTPPETYGKQARELVWEAIRRHQESGNSDYIILDRCAGTGNLELFLNEDVPDDIIDKDILSHCILNTYEYLEYKILHEKFIDKVRWIVPPVEKDDTFMAGLVRGSNALSEEFIKNEVIMDYINDQDCTVIIFENPPYTEATSIRHQIEGRGASSSNWKQSKAAQDSVSGKFQTKLTGQESNDMANVFIWSALEYYLKKPEDSLIVYSPMKYWKNASWMNKEFIRGFGFNRRYFHTKQDTVVSCILWGNNEVLGQEVLNLEMYDIENDSVVDMDITREVRRVYSFYSKEFYDKRKFENDEIETLKNIQEQDSNYTKKAIWNELEGIESEVKKGIRVQAKFNENIIGYLVAQSNLFEHPRTKTVLVRNAIYNGNGFHLRSDNFIEKLPMFAAGWWSTYNDDWTLDGITYRTGDGADRFDIDYKNKDEELINWLNKILFFTTLEYYTKIRSFTGTDKRVYINELCLDNNIDRKEYKSKQFTELGNKTLAYDYLERNDFFSTMSAEEKELFELWKLIIEESKTTAKYDRNKNYGPYQIEQELNTYKVTKNTRGQNIKEYDYKTLHGNLRTLRSRVKDYYNNEIVDKLFYYEFLK